MKEETLAKTKSYKLPWWMSLPEAKFRVKRKTLAILNFCFISLVFAMFLSACTREMDFNEPTNGLSSRTSITLGKNGSVKVTDVIAMKIPATGDNIKMRSFSKGFPGSFVGKQWRAKNLRCKDQVGDLKCVESSSVSGKSKLFNAIREDGFPTGERFVEFHYELEDILQISKDSDVFEWDVSGYHQFYPYLQFETKIQFPPESIEYASIQFQIKEVTISPSEETEGKFDSDSKIVEVFHNNKNFLSSNPNGPKNQPLNTTHTTFRIEGNTAIFHLKKMLKAGHNLVVKVALPKGYITPK